MDKKIKITIQIIGLVIITVLAVSIIQDLILIAFEDINSKLLTAARFILSIIIIYLLIKAKIFRDLDDILKNLKK